MRRCTGFSQVGNCSLENYIRCVVEEPVLVHAGEFVLVLSTVGLVVGMYLLAGHIFACLLVSYLLFVIFKFLLAHGL